jgi:alcohol dehydrogenase (cytochrome c)
MRNLTAVRVDPFIWHSIVFVMLTMASTLASCSREVQPARQAADWPGYNNGHDGQRFAALDQINTSNVSQLKRVCELQLGEEGPFHNGPVVIGDRMFITTAHTTVAINATNCFVYWRHVDARSGSDPISVNRGVAYLDGRVFRGMPGARLAAFDAETGKVLWDVKVGEPSLSEFLSSAPIAWNGIVFMGLAGGDWGIRGRVMGFDAETGKELWRFWTVPMGSERGAETWHIPETAERGGGAMWTSYTLDTMAGELFVPVGNPAPDFAPDARPGDNLFTNSVVVLDAKSGALKWWYQATPRDGFDYDMGAAPMLYTTRDGEPRFTAGSKDGFVHVVSRKSRNLLFKTPITTIFNADKKPTVDGIRACPGPLGGVEWNGPAFDPDTHSIYVGSVDWCATFVLGAEIEYAPGDLYMGTGHTSDPGEAAKGWVVALDAATGDVRWKFNTPQPVVAGVTPTSGGLLFTGDLGGTFYAFDKSNGNVLFTGNAGGAIAGGVLTYMVGGKQYVATTSGNISRSTFLTTGTPKVIIGALERPEGRPEIMVALPEVTGEGAPNVTMGSPAPAASGQHNYDQFCSSCHGNNGEGGAGGPSLLAPNARRELQAIADFIKNPNPPMPKLHPSPLDDAEVTAVGEYVRKLQSASPR